MPAHSERIVADSACRFPRIPQIFVVTDERQRITLSIEPPDGSNSHNRGEASTVGVVDGTNPRGNFIA
jgi:hypothetical protein